MGTGNNDMVSTTQKIWQAVANLDQADTHTAALCHAIINMMVRQGIVTRQEADRQIEESIRQVITVHQRIVNAMQDQNTGLAAHPEAKTIQ
jgi:hypothetical protein